MSTTPSKPAAEILGYKLEKRIGSGGFGEVWSVEAPGGIRKALKIVYGYHDEKRAQAELKALDRVKSLRHPFLLSLERIEVYEGQLIVVTELADASLADHFNDYLAKGEPGIPRDEMLRYMNNASEALDFLSIEKSLQHLDIKPENLLLVGKHVKVADFGLMKDLKAASQSLMQGMTPAYAAPELFDGKPAASSDQYSLAIMYCEMVSGVRPFPGTTPAQLAAQHVHGKPNLRLVPRGDQAAVARALSKDPSVRYPTCMAFVEDLGKQRRNVRVARKRTERQPAMTSSDTLLFNESQKPNRNDATEMASDRGLPFQPDSMVAGAPPACDGTKAKVHPTLIVTVGDTANKVGQKFKAKLMMQVGDTEAVPSIRSVFLDSDRNGLANLENIDKGTVRTSETIEMPLRRAEDYRAEADSYLGWLGRRWIYNVPRTLQTEGLRPLGRLAFADHFTTVCDQLEQVIGEFALEENLAKTADALNLDPAAIDAPKVYIISSISGGLGSGMTLDLAYTIKLLLTEKGLRDDGVTGILLHSSYQRSRDPGLAAANAFAFLTEMRHFNECGYPGDANLGIPDFDDEAPFQQTYYTELGDDLNQSDFNKKIDEVAEYVSLSVTTKCNEFFEACRASESTMEHFALRTFGVATAGAGDDKERRMLRENLCQKLIQRWCGVGADPRAMAQEILVKYNVSLDGIQQHVAQHMAQFRDVDSAQIQEQVYAQFIQQQDLRAAFDQIYNAIPDTNSGEDDLAAQPTPLTLAMENFLAGDVFTGQSAISKACVETLAGKDFFLGSTEGVVTTLTQLFGQWLEEVRQQHVETQGNIRSLDVAIAALPSPGAKGFCLPTTNQHLSQLCAEREREFTQRFTCQFLQVVINDLQPVRSLVDQLKSNLHSMVSEFTEEVVASFVPETGESFDLADLMMQQVESQLDAMAEQVGARVYSSFIEPEGGFQRALTDYSIQKYSLPQEMRVAAQQAISEANDSLCIETMLRENAIAPEQLCQWLNGFINMAKPVVNDCGGRMRTLVATPIRSEASRIPQLIETNCQLKNVEINGTNGKIAVCFEADDLSLASVAFRLLAKRPDAVELVKRIHTRNDINWTSLDDLL